MSVGDVTSNERGSGARFNTGKAPLHLIPLRIIAASMPGPGDSATDCAVIDAFNRLGQYQETHDVALIDAAVQHLDYDGKAWHECAAVFDYGRVKYAAWNWAKGMDWSIPLACAARHLLAILSGETTDPESGLPHRGHVMCNLVMLHQFARSFPSGNDLPPPALFEAPGEKDAVLYTGSDGHLRSVPTPGGTRCF